MLIRSPLGSRTAFCILRPAFSFSPPLAIGGGNYAAAIHPCAALFAQNKKGSIATDAAQTVGVLQASHSPVVNPPYGQRPDSVSNGTLSIDFIIACPPCRVKRGFDPNRKFGKRGKISRETAERFVPLIFRRRFSSAFPLLLLLGLWLLRRSKARETQKKTASGI